MYLVIWPAVDYSMLQVLDSSNKDWWWGRKSGSSEHGWFPSTFIRVSLSTSPALRCWLHIISVLVSEPCSLVPAVLDYEGLIYFVCRHVQSHVNTKLLAVLIHRMATSYGASKPCERAWSQETMQVYFLESSALVTFHFAINSARFLCTCVCSTPRTSCEFYHRVTDGKQNVYVPVSW